MRVLSVLFLAACGTASDRPGDAGEAADWRVPHLNRARCSSVSESSTWPGTFERTYDETGWLLSEKLVLGGGSVQSSEWLMQELADGGMRTVSPDGVAIVYDAWRQEVSGEEMFEPTFSCDIDRPEPGSPAGESTCQHAESWVPARSVIDACGNPTLEEWANGTTTELTWTYAEGCLPAQLRSVGSREAIVEFDDLGRELLLTYEDGATETTTWACD